jgi:hypothetical protein
MTIDPKKWEGRPKNPERDGFHILNREDIDSHTVARWDSASCSWDFTGSEWPDTPETVASQHTYLGPVSLPAQIEAERVRLREALAEIEKRANEARDSWLEARHTDDGDLYRTATAEAVKWARIGVHARAALEPTP